MRRAAERLDRRISALEGEGVALPGHRLPAEVADALMGAVSRLSALVWKNGDRNRPRLSDAEEALCHDLAAIEDEAIIDSSDRFAGRIAVDDMSTDELLAAFALAERIEQIRRESGGGATP